jgi:hypothetical protein
MCPKSRRLNLNLARAKTGRHGVGWEKSRGSFGTKVTSGKAGETRQCKPKGYNSLR